MINFNRQKKTPKRKYNFLHMPNNPLQLVYNTKNGIFTDAECPKQCEKRFSVLNLNQRYLHDIVPDRYFSMGTTCGLNFNPLVFKISTNRNLRGILRSIIYKFKSISDYLIYSLTYPKPYIHSICRPLKHFPYFSAHTVD